MTGMGTRGEKDTALRVGPESPLSSPMVPINPLAVWARPRMGLGVWLHQRGCSPEEPENTI